MQCLNHAISLYRESEKVKELKIAYALSEDKRERLLIRLSLSKLGYNSIK